jgi:hypothetical protein
MARDPAQGVINWFGWLMAAVLLFSATCAGLALRGLWLLVRHLLGG